MCLSHYSFKSNIKIFIICFTILLYFLDQSTNYAFIKLIIPLKGNLKKIEQYNLNNNRDIVVSKL